MTTLGKWAAKVHAHCLEHGPITVDQARTLFGNPRAGSATGCMNEAAKNGWFRKEHAVEDYEHVFHAIDRKVKTRKTPSYFDGMKRVRSVFDLGAIE